MPNPPLFMREIKSSGLKIFMIVFCFLPCSIIAQIEDLSLDVPFFEKKAKVYQRWLDTVQLGKAFRVDMVKLDEDGKTLNMYLLLKTRDPDTATVLWEQVSSDFKKLTETALLPTLFRVFVEMMEIPAAQGHLQIEMMGNNGQYSPCFYVAIRQKNGQPQMEIKPDDCRAQRIDLVIPPVQISQKVKGKKISSPRTLTGQQVYDTICQLAREMYPPNKYPNRSECAGKSPVVSCNATPYGFQIIISDLCKEVLTESSISTWCSVARAVGWDKTCSDIRRERIEFTFNYIQDGQSFKLVGNLSGKFGSGIYRPRDGGWMDMSPDFTSWERIFVDKFMLALTQRLSTQ